MTIHRSLPTDPQTCMPGDYAVLAAPYGAAYRSAIGARATHLLGGLFGKIGIEGNAIYLEPDKRVPDLIRGLGKVYLGHGSQVERVSFDSEHEKAIVALQYLQKLAELARQLARNETGNVEADAFNQPMGSGVTTDLQRIVDELADAGVSVVEKVSTKTHTERVVVLTTNAEAVRNGEILRDSVSFESEPTETFSVAVNVHDASRTRELLLSTQSMRPVAPPAVGEAVPPQNTGEMTLMRLLNLGGGLTANDIGLELPGDDDDDDDRDPGWRPEGM